MECPFCSTGLEKTKNEIIANKKFVRVIFSNPRLMPGHLLVIPKSHVERLSELNEAERKELFGTIIEFQEKILNTIASGCDVREHYRPFQKQDALKVNHIHFHLQPRELFDELYEKTQVFEKNIFQSLPSEELEELKKLLID